jgi:hypothetical protein
MSMRPSRADQVRWTIQTVTAGPTLVIPDPKSFLIKLIVLGHCLRVYVVLRSYPQTSNKAAVSGCVNASPWIR